MLSPIHACLKVSRSFGKLPFEMWLWDTYFSTLLSAESSKELAYANLIEITRPTAMGNVPGYRTATDSVQDRSKPFVGAMVLEMLYGKFKDVWLVELLFDDMLIWANWIRDRRIEEPAGLVVLGSDNVAPGQSDGMQCTRTAVAWESGLDNSPLYDTSEVEWDYPARNPKTHRVPVPIGTSCRIHLYDAGMTGLYLSMLDSLSTLAGVLNRTSDATELRARHTDMAGKLNTWLWNESMGIYANVQSRGANRTSPRLSPFNFHPMITGAASVAQAQSMASKWLLTDNGFCLTDQSSTTETDDDERAMEVVGSCGGCNITHGMDAKQPAAQVAPEMYNVSPAACCAACKANAGCETFVLGGNPNTAGVYPNCWLLANVTQSITVRSGRALGCVKGVSPTPIPPPPPSPPPKPPSPIPCKYGVPSISHGDSAYTDQSYWRGRTWGPMNFLVWKGLAHPKYKDVAEVTEARKRLVVASRKLLLVEWLDHHHVHENFNAATGRGCDVPNSNPFYHWGALLGVIGLMEDGHWATSGLP